jgi:hypothetical protein
MVTAGVNRQELIDAAKEDLNLFAAICIPEIFRFNFPPIFLAIWKLLTDNALLEVGQEKIAIGLPRGFGKTVLLKLFVAWLVAFSDRKFIIVVCNTATLAENFIADVVDILNSENFIRLFGDWRMTVEKDTQSLKKFAFRGRPVILAALGAGSSLRGLNIKYVRPDVMLMDDMQSREEAESQVESIKVLTWMLSTLLKANNKTRCLFTFVGNMYPYDGTILKKLKHNPAWFSFITGAILADGESIWPELRTVDDILLELENDLSMGFPEIFYSEVMNDEEAGTKSGVDISKINYFDTTEELHPEGGFILIDPSAGKKKSDDLAIGGFYTFSGKPVLWELSVDKYNPGQTISETLMMCMRMGVSSVIIEGVAYQSTLKYWFDLLMLQRGIKGITIYEIYPGAGSKNSRIITMLKQLVASGKDLQVHPNHKSKVLHQIVHFNPLKTNNVDDILDVLAYAYPALTQFGSALLLPFEAKAHLVEASTAETMDLAF